jgi:hypothetical protein
MLDEWAKLNNISRLELAVVSSNVPAVNLYKKSGFVDVSVGTSWFSTRIFQTCFTVILIFLCPNVAVNYGHLQPKEERWFVSRRFFMFFRDCLKSKSFRPKVRDDFCPNSLTLNALVSDIHSNTFIETTLPPAALENTDKTVVPPITKDSTGSYTVESWCVQDWPRPSYRSRCWCWVWAFFIINFKKLLTIYNITIYTNNGIIYIVPFCYAYVKRMI